MSSTIIRTGVAALGATIALGGVAWGASSMSTANADQPAVTKRLDGDDAVVLVADDDDDDDGARKADTNTNTRSRISRGTRHSRVSARSNDRTRSNKTRVSRDRDRSRGDKTRDWTRDGGDRTRDVTANRTNDRSRNDTRRRR